MYVNNVFVHIIICIEYRPGNSTVTLVLNTKKKNMDDYNFQNIKE